MNTITFKSNSKSKLNQLVKVAREMGIKAIVEHALTDEEMALPGPKVSETQLEEWLAKDDGNEEYTTREMVGYVKKQLAKSRKKADESSLQTARKKRYS
jgi:predicted metal-dependent phosphoesterase TrpH